MLENINILHVCGRFKTGGIKTFVKSIIELNKTNNTVHDVLFIGEIDRNEIQYQCKVHYLNYRKRNFFSFFKNVKQICNQYNSIMIHSAHPIIIFPLLFFKKKIYLFQHGMTVSSGFILKRILKKIWFSLLPIVLNAKIICSTDFAFKKARKLGILLQRKRNIIVPFGVKIKIENSRLRDIREKEIITVGMANALVPAKRNDLVLKYFLSYNGIRKINLKIAGDGPELPHLKKLAEGIENKNVQIDFLGKIDDMNVFYNEIDVFIFPSKAESFGLVILEALTRFIPVVVFRDVGGCLSAIKDGKNGFVVKNDIEGLKFIWKILNENPEIIYKQSKFISEMDLGKYNIVNTRLKLDNIVGSNI